MCIDQTQAVLFVAVCYTIDCIWSNQIIIGHENVHCFANRIQRLGENFLVPTRLGGVEASI